MSVKRFTFSVEETGSKLEADFFVEAERVDAAFRLGMDRLPPAWREAGEGLRMWRIRICNERTGEQTGALGQGETVLAAWEDILANAKESFVKRDGKRWPPRGFPVLLPARRGDLYAVGRCVSRPVESFESDETYQQQRARLLAAPKAA